MSDDPRRRPGFALDPRAWAFVLCVTGLRMAFALGSDLQLYGDEAQYWVWSRDLAWGAYSKPPLLGWLIRATTTLAGPSEFAVRLASPLLHAGTAMVLGATADRLHGRSAGRWAAALYTSVPAVSLSSLLISTDVPLLFFWSVALYAWVRLLQAPRLGWALLLGVACGLGLLSKYAMVYFWVAAPLSLLRARPLRRGVLGHSLLAVVVSLVLLAPNLVWNAQHQFHTFRHTGVNAGLDVPDLNPLAVLEYLASQAGVLGPVLFGLWCTLLWRRGLGRGSLDRALLPFQLLPLLVVLPVALVRGANANWSATAFPAICVQVAQFATVPRARRWLRAAVVSSLAIVGLAFSAAPLLAALGRPIPGRLDPWRRLRGGRALGLEAGRLLEAWPGTALLCDDRMTLARLAYYLPEDHGHPWSWSPGGGVQHHFDLIWPASAAGAQSFVFLTRRDSWPDVEQVFTQVRPLPDLVVPSGPDSEERYRVLLLHGPR